MGSMPAGAVPPLAEVQGNILRAYGKEYRAVRHLVVRIVDPAAARRALASMVDGDRGTPDVTSAQRAPSEAGFGWCLNLGFTSAGLLALGVPETSVATFPPEFVEGMVPAPPGWATPGPAPPATGSGVWPTRHRFISS